MLEQTRLQQWARMQNLRKLAERGYDVAENFDAVESDLAAIKAEQERRAELQPE